MELKSSVQYRPKFWKQLIPKIKSVYQGKLTYSANWDNFDSVPFWDQLDYIGIDAYFPLSQSKKPDKATLIKKWQKYEKLLSKFSNQMNKEILFTEIGYRSTDQGAGNQWKIENRPDHVAINIELQKTAYEAFFETCWNKSWFAGSFIWEWHAFDKHAGGLNHSNYSPQNKPTEKCIKKWYGLSI